MEENCYAAVIYLLISINMELTDIMAKVYRALILWQAQPLHFFCLIKFRQKQELVKFQKLERVSVIRSRIKLNKSSREGGWS